MLVLSRKKTQRVVLTGPAVVTILDSKGTVKLGIVADATTKCFREEVADGALGEDWQNRLFQDRGLECLSPLEYRRNV